MFEKYLTKTGRLSCKQPQDIKNQWYIQKFQEVHGDTYDYIKVIYVGSAQKVEIVCKEHGSFFQTPNDHLKGIGCQKYKDWQVFNPTVRNGGTEFFGLTDQQVSWLIESLKIA